MTYQEIMSAIAQMLRRPAVTDVTSTSVDVSLWRQAINNAKREIEGAHDWVALDKTVSVPLVGGVAQYPLTGLAFTDRWVTQEVIDTTNNAILKPLKLERLARMRDTATTADGRVEYYTFIPPVAPDTNVPRVEFFPGPNIAANVNFYVNAPQADLAVGTDRPLVPAQLIVLGAYARLYSERGEAVSVSPLLGNPLQDFRNALSDAIARDQELQGKDDWQVSMVDYEVYV